MIRRRAWTVLMAILATAAVARAAIPEPSAESLLKRPSWRAPEVAAVKTQAIAWLDQQQAAPEIRQKAEEVWSAAPDATAGDEILVRLGRTFALVDDNARNLTELCAGPRPEGTLPSQPWLTAPATPPFVAANMRLLYGIWLVQQSLIDEAQEQLAGLKPEAVVDPASLLFYQSVVHHRLLEKDSGLKSIERLLEGGDQSPRRYTAVARLMQEDLKGLKDDSLDHISRRMEDIRRRLELGRAGPKVRKIEDGVVESLDKLIKELEEQQKQQQQASSGGNMQPSNPASDSRPMEGKGKGEVTKKNFGNQEGWGDLPPKQREEAMQQIGREFPSHYRDAIEQYFRKMAAGGEERGEIGN